MRLASSAAKRWQLTFLSDMALKSTIFKANLQIADIDHGYYADHALTLARHPSETDERMMVRLAALALHATSCNACATATARWLWRRPVRPGRPGCLLRDFTGRTRLWIEVGQPEDKPSSRPAARPTRWWCIASTTPPRSGGAASRTSSRGRRT
jgi:uncharacterized protein YaeQ